MSDDARLPTSASSRAETTTEVDIDRDLVVKDIYIVLNGFEADSKQANFTVFINPLVNFVWMGFGLLAVCLAAALAPGDSWRYWTGVLWNANQIGHLDRIPNQSVWGTLLRIYAPHQPSR